ncbi:class I SAM-dependent methyltransferase [Sphingomonas nostoxanthinifaciens]|uniref:class I SAM-dependent methyltransferase n=1 Tax=Sphingomonas nostoxanthinifaciens TaxID=2872652 RepID=UPI001CC1D23C|nr:methyltransferase [Sphingomonas nostoxanthinifaciens]UAK25586.1 methyltransferase [Sphingomonas nostoxanthinifaciens]
MLATQSPLAAQEAKSGQAAVDESRGDALTNPIYKGPEVIAFMGVRPGFHVAEIVAGRFTRALSQSVGPAGVIYAIEPAEVVKVHPQVMGMMTGLSAQPGYGNIKLMTDPIDGATLPGGLDAVFIRQNYHDLHDPFMGPADVAALNRKIYAALKPGGVFVILDHVAAAGSGLSQTDTLHRIDPATVKAEVTAAGFLFDGQSTVLANPADPHDKNVFDPSIRGRTDQFLYRFRKPQ